MNSKSILNWYGFDKSKNPHPMIALLVHNELPHTRSHGTDQAVILTPSDGSQRRVVSTGSRVKLTDAEILAATESIAPVWLFQAETVRLGNGHDPRLPTCEPFGCRIIASAIYPIRSINGQREFHGVSSGCGPDLVAGPFDTPEEALQETVKFRCHTGWRRTWAEADADAADALDKRFDEYIERRKARERILADTTLTEAEQITALVKLGDTRMNARRTVRQTRKAMIHG